MSTKMNWKDIAELIGITAIVVSLIALVIELRQTQASMVAATYQARAFDAIRHLEGSAESELMLPLLVGIDLTDPQAKDSLTELEQRRVASYLIARLVDIDNEFYQYQNGFLDDEYFEYWFKPTVQFYGRQWRAWGIREFRPSFSAFVDRVLAEDS